MYAIRSYYVYTITEHHRADRGEQPPRRFGCLDRSGTPDRLRCAVVYGRLFCDQIRITSYNVCYTKLLRTMHAEYTHYVHTALGHIALKNNDIDAALEHLIESGKVISTPRLSSYGPRITSYNVCYTKLLRLFYRKVSETNSSVAALWATGGTVSDSVEVHPLADNIYSSLCTLKSHLFFYAGKSKELWASDGTVEGTEKLLDDSRNNFV